MKRRVLWPLIILCCIAGVPLILASGRCLSGQTVTVASDATPNSPAYVFRLQMSVGTVGEYTECSGLGSSSDIVQSTTTNAAGSTVVKETPGALHWHNIILRRTGVSDDTFVWVWREDFAKGHAGQIYWDGATIMTKAGSSEPLAQWNFTKGWAASLTFDGGVEQLVIVHEGLQRVTPPGEMPPRR